MCRRKAVFGERDAWSVALAGNCTSVVARLQIDLRDATALEQIIFVMRPGVVHNRDSKRALFLPE